MSDSRATFDLESVIKFSIVSLTNICKRQRTKFLENSNFLPEKRSRYGKTIPLINGRTINQIGVPILVLWCPLMFMFGEIKNEQLSQQSCPAVISAFFACLKKSLLDSATEQFLGFVCGQTCDRSVCESFNNLPFSFNVSSFPIH